MMIKLWLLLLGLHVHTIISSITPPEYFNIGVMFLMQRNNIPLPSNRHFAAIMMALEDLNNKTDGIYDDILPNTILRPAVRSPNDGFYNSVVYAKELTSIDNGKGIKVNIGPYGTPAVEGAVPAFKEAGGIPLIGYNERSSIISNSLIYSNILRTVPSMYYDAYAIAALISQYFSWDKVTVLSDNSDDGRASSQFFRYYALQYQLTILSSHVFDETLSDYTVDILEAKNVGARVFVMFMSAAVGSKLLKQGYQLGLFKNDVQIIGGEGMSLGDLWRSSGLDLETLTPLLRGYIGVKFRWNAPASPLKKHFLDRWVGSKSTSGNVDVNGNRVCDNTTDHYGDFNLYQFYPNGDTTQPPVCSGVNFTGFRDDENIDTELDSIMYAYDATIAAALALHHMVYDMNIPDPCPRELMQYLLHNTSFTGLTGKVTFLSDHDYFNHGGRGSAILYDVVNFVPPKLLNGTNTSAVTWDDVFLTVISWHSEEGFTPCEGTTKYVADSPCFTFHFNTRKNTAPLDSPPPRIEWMSLPVVVFLRLFAALGLCVVLIVAMVTYAFGHRRLVRMSQPVLKYFKLAGFLLAYLRIIFTSIRPTTEICVARMWLEHLGFQLIFATLLIRSWRVYLVTGTLKRTKVSDLKSSLIIMSIIVVIIILLIVGTYGSVGVKHVVVSDTQFEYTLQPTCSYNNRVLTTMIYAFDVLILVAALRYCWMIRKVSSTIGNTSALVETFVTSLVVIVSTSSIVMTVDMTPLITQFFVSMVMGLLVSRIMWILESQLVINLMLGYELDRALMLRKTEKGLLCFRGSNKVNDFAKNDPSMESMSATNGLGTGSVEDSMFIKGLEKYSKLKNKGELEAEIARLKAENRRNQIELVCLENMMFASEHDSKSQSGRRSSHGQQMEPATNLEENGRDVENL